jgi:hypothetical protein
MNHRAIHDNWKKMRAKCAQFEATALDLLAHPDATPEMIAEVREKLIAQRKTQLEVWESVEKLFVRMYVKPEPPTFIMARRARQQEKAHE